MIMTMVQILALIYFIIALYWLIYSIMEQRRVEKECEEVRRRLEEMLKDLSEMEEEDEQIHG